MSWSVPTQLQASLEEAEVAPIVVARLHVPPLSWLTVVNYAVGAGDTVTVNANVAQTITAGVDFTPMTSNDATAQAIAIAWNSSVSRVLLSQAIAIWRGGRHVAFRALNPASSVVTITSSDANAWSGTVVPANPTLFDLCSTIGVHHPALADMVPIVAEMARPKWSINPITRELSTPRIDVPLVDPNQRGFFRNVCQYYNLRRAQVDLYFSTYGDAITAFPTHFMQLPTMFLENLQPAPGRVTLKLVDAHNDVWRDRIVGGAWTGWHPLQVALDIFEKADAVPSVHYNAASFDYETADPGKSHFCMSHYWDEVFGFENDLLEGKKAGELLNEVLALMYGTMRPQQTGALEYVPFNRNATSVAQLECAPVTGHDVDEVEQDGVFENQIDDVTISFGRGQNGKQLQFRDNDAIAFFESQGQFSSFSHKTDWLNSRGQTSAASAQYVHVGGSVYGNPHPFPNSIFDDTSEYPVQYASRQGFCGSQRMADGSFAPGMSMGAAVGRWAVHRISGTLVGEIQRSDLVDEIEYVLVDQWTAWLGTYDDPAVQAPPPGRAIFHPDAMSARITSDAIGSMLSNGDTIEAFFGAGSELAPKLIGRGIHGTSAPDNWQNPFAPLNETQAVFVDDVTIAFYLARELVLRFRYGAPPVSVYAPLHYIWIDLGEFVTLGGDDMVISYLRGMGADPNLVFEVIGKEITILGDKPGIVFDLCAVRDDSRTSFPVQVQDTVYSLSIPGTQIATGSGSVSITILPPANTEPLPPFLAEDEWSPVDPNNGNN